MEVLEATRNVQRAFKKCKNEVKIELSGTHTAHGLRSPSAMTEVAYPTDVTLLMMQGTEIYL